MKNKLSVFKCYSSRRYYLLHPWRWIHDIYWNFRNFIHRGKYGFAYVDVWNFCDWWPQVAASALKYMAENGLGYPGAEPYDTPERWRAHLLALAGELEWCAEINDICYTDDHEMNEYRKTFEKMMERCDIENALTEEEKEIRKKYFDREQEIRNELAEKRARIFADIGRNLGQYWN